ncbi:hypothetical protein ABRM43_002133 [Escherichia coli]
MAELTKEQLIEEVKLKIAIAKCHTNSGMAQVEGELFKIALASLEAKPIGAFHIAEQQVDGTSDYIKDGEWPIDNGTIEVYATLPAPVVPEEKPMPNPLSMLEREITQLIGDAQEATVTGYELIAEAWRLMDGQDPKTSDWHSKASKYLNSNIVEKVDDDLIEAVKAVLRRLAGNYPVTPGRLPGGFTIEDAKELHENLVRSHISQALSGEKMKKKDRDADLRWIHGVIVQAAWFVKASLEALPEPLQEEKGGSANCTASHGTTDNPPVPGKQINELTMLVEQLVSQLKKAKPDCKLPDKAMDYLKRNGLISVEDILR